MKNRFLALPAIALLALAPACSSENSDDAATTTEAADGTNGPAVTESDASEDLSIAENLAAMADLSTLNDAVAAAGLTETLGGAGPYTVFAPTNAAFAAVDGAPDMIAAGGPPLVSLLNYHIVPGVITAADLSAAIDDNDGAAEIATMTGAMLTARKDGDDLTLTDGAGNTVRITGADNAQQNGMVHIVDGVLHAE